MHGQLLYQNLNPQDNRLLLETDIICMLFLECFLKNYRCIKKDFLKVIMVKVSLHTIIDEGLLLALAGIECLAIIQE